MPPKINSDVAIAGALEAPGRNGALSPVGHARLLGLALALMVLAALAAVTPTSAHAEECPNAAFRTGSSAHLPDCRAYELVTPPYKNAGSTFRLSSGPEGSPGVFVDSTALPGAEGFQNIATFLPGTYYLTERTAAGWVSTSEDLPSTEYEAETYELTSLAGISLDGRSMVWQARTKSQAENRIDLYLRRPDRSIADIGPMLPPSAPSGTPFSLGQYLEPMGISSDASHVLFSLKEGVYWPFDESLGTGNAARSLYEYAGVENTSPMLVGVNNTGRQIGQCGDTLGGYGDGLRHNAMSTDGEIVFFTVLPDNYESDGCLAAAPPVLELYARIDNGQPDAHTVTISEPSKEDCSACDTEPGVLARAFFQGASEDGSKIFFATTQPLLGGDTSNNLYEYDFDAPPGQRVTRISGSESGGASTAAEVQSPSSDPTYAEVSEDGSHVYFLAKGVLTRSPNAQGEEAEAGADNLYVYERESAYPDGHLAFIAKTVPDEENVTPDGRFLVFTSSDDLTPDDTSTARQVFEYDAQSGQLTRVSVGQDGYNDDGNALDAPADDARIAAPGYGEYVPAAYWSRLSVSADGSYVFFQSPVGLTPEAADRKIIGHRAGGEPIYAQNVYEYHDGRVSLISDGQDITEIEGSSVVQLEGTDASGQDVFFSTVDRLVGQDVDTNLDVYDARVDGGYPAPVAPASCLGDACQGTLSAAPELLSPGSEFQAGGNPPLAGPSEAATAKKPKQRKSVKKSTHVGKKKVKRRRKGKASKVSASSRSKRKAGRS